MEKYMSLLGNLVVKMMILCIKCDGNVNDYVLLKYFAFFYIYDDINHVIIN